MDIMQLCVYILIILSDKNVAVSILHLLQPIRKRTFRTFRRNIYQAKSSRTQTQTRKMLLLQETHTVPWTSNLSRRHPTPTRETRKQS